ncbi:transketolase [Candidatus Curtissbacteria bacterium RIFCSPHIGHO2_01_FULL_41_11]|uniref:Transketolase n=1 Tax=Candidatus Curtissbacteria bacterium RIFCSPHIGHO2_01_FULL_41_11 TaxID=1797711 RepID=A0A1F5G8N8_9BACT|nr:MAG: transketolase [Candidatus Curtissbacteria bacterium RIFCSPHIGHO2_01_FULL_41_11]
MLNPELKLNEKVFDEDVEQMATREGYGEGLVELGEKNPNVVALCADLTESTKVEGFAKKFPERYFEVGVAEQNMAAIAAGLAISGKVPFISSYATFSPGKNWETIRTTIVYNQANVKIAGHHSGIVTGPDGATHQATEDIALMRTLPKVSVIVPCDSHQAQKATIAACSLNGPVYLRFTRDKTSVITTTDTPFEVGKVYKYFQSESPKAVIFGTGHLLYQALLAAGELEGEGTGVTVVNVPTIKPLDVEAVLNLVKEAGAVVCVEDHQIEGGLGGAIAELLAGHMPAPMEFIGLRNTFAESGKPQELIEKYGLGKEAIVAAVKKVILRK